MGAKRLALNHTLRVALLIGSCFLLGSTGWLAWVYHLMELAPAEDVSALTIVLGYLMQAIGLGLYSLMGQRIPATQLQRLAIVCIVTYVLALAPSIISPALEAALGFGYVANIACGVFIGRYLHALAQDVDSSNRGTAFGCAYAASTVFSWLFSLPYNGALLHGTPAFALCAILAIPAAFLVSRPGTTHTSESDDANRDDKTPDHRIALLACGTVLLASLVKNAGYSFPISDIDNGVDLEQLRLLYGLGLCAAGFVSDKKRSYGALCCMTALVTPFLMLSLQGMDASSVLLWAVDYLLFGFFTVFRVLLLVDIASDAGKEHLAGAGMLFGRIGDALGTALCLVFAFAPLALICVTAVLFALTTAAFFLLYQRLYVAPPSPAPELSEQAVFDRFAARHDLSAREQEVLQLVLNKSSNQQIASELFVSESTVKFHIRNLLRKTGCKNRLEVMRLYSELRDGAA